MAAPRPLFLLAACWLLFAGCRDQKVSSYRVPKEKEPALPSAAPAAMTAGGATMPTGDSTNNSMANTAVTTAQGNDLVWTAPATWKAKAASAMRKGSYAVGPAGAEADLSVTAFPGDVGGDLANLNRWRGQIQLPPLAAADLATATTHGDSNGLHLTIVDFANDQGPTPQRILGAIVPYEGATWFFKLMGPAPTVAAAQADFTAFLKTIQAASAP